MKDFLFIVVVGTFIGWITNYIAIKLLYFTIHTIGVYANVSEN